MSSTSAIETIAAATAKDFLRVLDRGDDSWGKGLDCLWIFRGHGDSEWQLQPRAWREDGQRILQPLLMRYEETDPLELWEPETLPFIERHCAGQLANAVTGMRHIAAEAEAVKSFAELADGLRLAVPDSALLKDGGLKYLRSPVAQGWPRFEVGTVHCLAQHHGVPTRLLDWTRNPRVAAFFAAEQCYRFLTQEVGFPFDPEGHNPSAPASLCVWAISVEFIRSLRPPLFREVTCPRVQHSFLHAQEGLFLVYDQAQDYFHQHGEWPNFADLLMRQYEGGESPLRRFELPATEASTLLTLLWRDGVSRAHLMPTYDNVTQSLHFKWLWHSQQEWACRSCKQRNPGHRYACSQCGAWSATR